MFQVRDGELGGVYIDVDGATIAFPLGLGCERDTLTYEDVSDVCGYMHAFGATIATSVTYARMLQAARFTLAIVDPTNERNNTARRGEGK